MPCRRTFKDSGFESKSTVIHHLSTVDGVDNLENHAINRRLEPPPQRERCRPRTPGAVMPPRRGSPPWYRRRRPERRFQPIAAACRRAGDVGNDARACDARGDRVRPEAAPIDSGARAEREREASGPRRLQSPACDRFPDASAASRTWVPGPRPAVVSCISLPIANRWSPPLPRRVFDPGSQAASATPRTSRWRPAIRVRRRNARARGMNRHREEACANARAEANVLDRTSPGVLREASRLLLQSRRRIAGRATRR